MTCTITGLFDTRQAAETAVRHLLDHDHIRREGIRLHGREETDAGAAAGGEDQGIWASLKSLFMPDEDRYAYSEGIRRGGVVLSVEVEDSQVDHAMDVFEQNGAVDLDSREAEWRSGGWAGYDAGSYDTGRSMSSPAVGVDAPGYDSTVNTPSPAYTAGGMGLASGATGTPDGVEARGERRAGATAAPAGSAAGITGSDLNAVEPTGRPATGREEVLPVVEEELRVGKRDTERGRVRVRSYIQERPVSESVSLRQEQVKVQRRAVDRPLDGADDAFRERSIEAVEHGEEAVVSKAARVVEEVTISKDSTQREETVHETVRRQDVEIEDDRAGAGTPMPRNPA